MTNAESLELCLKHRVSYGETDTMGVLYYAEYLHIFERARTEYTHLRGFPYKEVEKRGVFLPVREARCRYRSPARYDDVLNVFCGIREWRKASFNFVYRVEKEEDSSHVAEGVTNHALVNNLGRPIPVPDWFFEAYAQRQ